MEAMNGIAEATTFATSEQMECHPKLGNEEKAAEEREAAAEGQEEVEKSWRETDLPFLEDLEELKEKYMSRVFNVYSKGFEKTVRRLFPKTEDAQELAKQETLKERHLTSIQMGLFNRFDDILSREEFQEPLNRLYAINSKLTGDAILVSEAILPVKVKFVAQLKGVNERVDNMLDSMSAQLKEAKVKAEKADRRVKRMRTDLIIRLDRMVMAVDKHAIKSLESIESPDFVPLCL